MKKKKISFIAISFVALLIILISAIILFFYKFPHPSEERKVIDDRISPMENQALYVEILRIRNRSLMEKMLSYGRSWKNAPSFYYKIAVDGREVSTKGYIGESGIYETWDTAGYESVMVFDVEEEKAFSDVTISIIEIEKGIFGEQEVDKEKIRLRYDYRIGEWKGDDCLRDNDGLGHYLGENYEIWFNLYQADFDNDGIPYWTEVNILGTNPLEDDRETDFDNDGIPTSWEWRYGYDPFTYNEHKNLDPDIDGLTNYEEYLMRKYFADPFQPDIYIETDGMEKRGIIDIEHVFYKESQQMIIERFAHHGINVYIDDGWMKQYPNGGGELLPNIKNPDDVIGKQILAFYRDHFPDERKGIFRYVIIGSREDGGGFATPLNYNKFDTIYTSNDFNSIKKRLAFTPREIRVMLAKTVLHELGHTIGLMPGVFPGIDIMSRRFGDRYPSMSEKEYNSYLKDYYSVMNYQYIYNKPWFFSKDGKYLFDYSDGSNGQYDFNDWAHIYLPTFKIDMPFYEDPFIETFEDFKVVNEYPEIDGNWIFNQNLTEKYGKEFSKFAKVKNADVEIKIYVNEKNKEGYNLRVYAKPKVEPVFAIYSLVAEGRISDGKIRIHDF
ncbi:MAG: hypothetical protein H5T44_01185 [Thermoplasmatales archaeon]|nr:hypothetical protein [Thermoplasmatales archaeon]